MPTYPALNEYNSAVQHPRLAFSDTELKIGKVETTGHGLPRALGGGFAITYTIASGNHKYAVRCFHKGAPDLERRYRSISSAVVGDNSGYFVKFEYEPTGILVNGTKFPIVKMDWAEGKTLGAWLENNISNKTGLVQLREQFRSLEAYLRSKSYAHGDLQNGNVIINGRAKLIDYDGFYVPGLAVGQGTELGHKHFQHPNRSPSDFGPHMDRFSFIVMDLSLYAVSEDPSLFQKYSNGENIIFCASDFRDPSQSNIFRDLFSKSIFKDSALNFARVCAAQTKDIPTLDDFLHARNIPAKIVQISARTNGQSSLSSAYIGAFDVVDAKNYAAMKTRVGDRVELVGQIVEVRRGTTRHRKAYTFLNFGNWRSNQVKINIWSEGLSILTATPDTSWQGKWISVTGLVDPPYTNRRIGYTHLSITITEANQLRVIDQSEAQRRLAAIGNAAANASRANAAVLNQMNNRPRQTTQAFVGVQTLSGSASNQRILSTIRGTTPSIQQSHSPASQVTAPGASAFPTPVATSSRVRSLFKWGIAAAIACFVIYKLFGGQDVQRKDVRHPPSPYSERVIAPDRSSKMAAPIIREQPLGEGTTMPPTSIRTNIDTHSPSNTESRPQVTPVPPAQPDKIASLQSTEPPSWPPPVNIPPGHPVAGLPETSQGSSIVPNALNSPPSAAPSDNQTVANVVGLWTETNNGNCASPLRITQDRAENARGTCEFVSKRRDGPTLRVKAQCTVDNAKWTANIVLSVSGDTLSWSSERGKAIYVKCASN